MRDCAREESCPKCQKSMERIYSSRVELLYTAVQHPEYNPAFGKVVNSRQHRAELAKQYNMIELGNEKPDSLHKHFEREREERRERRWNED